MKMNSRNAGDLIVLGDDATKGQRSGAAGVLRGIRDDPRYKGRKQYTLAGPGNKEVTLAGAAAIDARLGGDDVRHFCTFHFTGWGNSPNGKYKAIHVAVSDETYDDADDVAWDELDSLGEDEFVWE